MAATEELNRDDRATTALRAALETLGLVCLLAALALLSMGVRIARADEPAALMSTGPALLAKSPPSGRPGAVAPSTLPSARRASAAASD